MYKYIYPWTFFIWQVTQAEFEDEEDHEPAVDEAHVLKVQRKSGPWLLTFRTANNDLACSVLGSWSLGPSGSCAIHEEGICHWAELRIRWISELWAWCFANIELNLQALATISYFSCSKLKSKWKGNGKSMNMQLPLDPLGSLKDKFRSLLVPVPLFIVYCERLSACFFGICYIPHWHCVHYIWPFPEGLRQLDSTFKTIVDWQVVIHQSVSNESVYAREPQFGVVFHFARLLYIPAQPFGSHAPQQALRHTSCSQPRGQRLLMVKFWSVLTLYV